MWPLFTLLSNLFVELGCSITLEVIMTTGFIITLNSFLISVSVLYLKILFYLFIKESVSLFSFFETNYLMKEESKINLYQIEIKMNFVNFYTRKTIWWEINFQEKYRYNYKFRDNHVNNSIIFSNNLIIIKNRSKTIVISISPYIVDRSLPIKFWF
jgi:hypothetical protein